jgi:hypothetical protein
MANQLIVDVQQTTFIDAEDWRQCFRACLVVHLSVYEEKNTYLVKKIESAFKGLKSLKN